MKSIIAKILFWALVALSVLSVGLSIAATVTYLSTEDGWILQSMVVFVSWVFCSSSRIDLDLVCGHLLEA